MKLSFKSMQDLAKSPRGKQLVKQAKAMDTPENRKRAMDMLGKLRGGKKRTGPDR
jgi:hypothetical protein